MDKILFSDVKEITPIKGRILMGTSNNLQDDAGEAVITNLLRAGFEALALGADLNPSQYIKALRKFSPQVLILFKIASLAILSATPVYDDIAIWSR